MPRREKFILMHHPEAGGEAKTTQDGFDRVWKAKGWVKGKEPRSAKTTTETKKEGEV